MSTPAERSDRRTTIADSAIRIIARDGVRALTHRAVDREADVPSGTTSYHAKTRSALLEIVIDTLSERAIADAHHVTISLGSELVSRDRVSVAELTDALVGLVDTLVARTDDMRARYALILELADRPDLRDRLTAPGDVHEMTTRIAAAALAKAGVPSDVDQVEALTGLTDALVLARTVIGREPDRTTAIIGNYLRGLGEV
ncbi:TetR family transcriptional regulator [Gordonia malaquae]|uniref:TetR/AcrR family transcriptional regulator n=1 Tax=Gordonia malaquae TaxID=410332 RepID=UPI003017B132